MDITMVECIIREESSKMRDHQCMIFPFIR